MASSSCSSEFNDEERALKDLLDAFSSNFSLQEIASVYCKAGCDAFAAGEMLCDMQSYSYTHASDSDVKCEISSKSSSTNGSEGSCYMNGDAHPKASKTKQRAVSMGSISSVLGKTYLRSTPLTNEILKEKPLRVDAGNLMTAGSSRECSPVMDASLQKDFENFLFEMLGSGFQLDRDVIREVLGQCGYNIKKSVEELLERSITQVDKRDIVNEGIVGRSESVCSQYSIEKNVGGTNGGEEVRQVDKRYEQQKEILTALFSAPERPKEPERPPKIQRRPSAFGPVVVGPFEDPFEESESRILDMQHDEMGDGDDTYAPLRQAVEEYRGMMKEYYKAAAEAFAKGEKARARTLLEQGQFFHEKARQADEESAQRIFEISGRDCGIPEETTLSLDLRNHDPKGAVHLLKCHLLSLSGIPSFTHINIMVGINGEDVSRTARRRLVLKLLERESIKWTEDEASGMLGIRLDEINPDRLSFSKKGS